MIFGVCNIPVSWELAHWRVSLTAGLLITGLLITGLHWTGILKLVFYALWYAIAVI